MRAVLGYAVTLKWVALQALDSAMISQGWAWIGPSDVLHSEQANIPGELRVHDAKQALNGWLYFQEELQFEAAFVESVKDRTAADFGIQNDGNSIAPSSLKLYDVCTRTFMFSWHV